SALQPRPLGGMARRGSHAIAEPGETPPPPTCPRPAGRRDPDGPSATRRRRPLPPPRPRYLVCLVAVRRPRRDSPAPETDLRCRRTCRFLPARTRSRGVHESPLGAGTAGARSPPQPSTRAQYLPRVRVTPLPWQLVNRGRTE